MGLLSRQEALKIGSKSYHTGRPCKYGHYAWRSTEGKFCLECNRQRATERYYNLTPQEREVYCRRSSYATESRLLYERERRRNPVVRVKKNLRSRISHFIKSKSLNKRATLLDILGCSWDELRQHLERKFTPGMTWENYGAWHVDHKQALAKAATIDEVEQLNHFSNLQPLWAKDNLQKSGS